MSRRDFWARHVKQWRKSGLIARDYAASVGINPLTLRYMKCVLKKQASERALVLAPRPASMPMVEVVSTGQTDGRFELQFLDGMRLRVPPSFEADALRRLLGVLGGAA